MRVGNACYGGRMIENADQKSTSRPKLPRAPHWRLRSRTLQFGPLPHLMGIVNVTPDSFSDGGKFFDPQRAVEHGLRLAAEGAEILDVGGESTRPYSTAVEEAEELRRVLPVVSRLVEQTRVPISIDTSKPGVAREAIAAGAEILNDITGLTDPRMIECAVDSGVGVCVMHMQGTPQTMQDDPRYSDVVGEILEYLAGRQRQLVAAGIASDRICLDPGVGFGKTHQHNLTLLRESFRFHALGSPVLVGPSRKGFIAHVLKDKETDRTPGTLGVTVALAAQGIQIVRVHDVGPVRQGLLLYAAAGGSLPIPDSGSVQ